MLQTTLPTAPNAPIADASGNITPVWQAVMLALISRTGGTAGVSSSETQAGLTRLVNLQAAAAAAGSVSAEAAAREAADSAEAQARSAADQALDTRIGAALSAAPAPLLTRLWFNRGQ